MKTFTELKKLDIVKLNAELLDITKKLAKIRFDVDNGHEKNHDEIGNYKAQRARIKMLMAEMNNSAAPEEEKKAA